MLPKPQLFRRYTIFHYHILASYTNDTRIVLFITISLAAFIDDVLCVDFDHPFNPNLESVLWTAKEHCRYSVRA